MDNKEAVLDALKEFGKKPSTDIPPLLEEYIRFVAKNGKTVFPWVNLKPLLIEKVKVEMMRFHDELPGDDDAAVPNVENIKFTDLKERIIRRVNAFSGAPFTIQRVCELLTDPKKHYRRSDKFLRGMERNMNVVSTVDPFGRKIVSESRHLLNGIVDRSINDTPKAKRLPPPPPCTPTTQSFTPPQAFNSPLSASIHLKARANTLFSNNVTSSENSNLTDDNGDESADVHSENIPPSVNDSDDTTSNETCEQTNEVDDENEKSDESSIIPTPLTDDNELSYDDALMAGSHAVYMDLPPVDHNIAPSLVTADSPAMALSPSASYTNLETMERVSAADSTGSNHQLYSSLSDTSNVQFAPASQFYPDSGLGSTLYPIPTDSDNSASQSVVSSTDMNDQIQTDLEPDQIQTDVRPLDCNIGLDDAPLQFKTITQVIPKVDSAEVSDEHETQSDYAISNSEAEAEHVTSTPVESCREITSESSSDVPNSEASDVSSDVTSNMQNDVTDITNHEANVSENDVSSDVVNQESNEAIACDVLKSDATESNELVESTSDPATHDMADENIIESIVTSEVEHIDTSQVQSISSKVESSITSEVETEATSEVASVKMTEVDSSSEVEVTPALVIPEKFNQIAEESSPMPDQSVIPTTPKRHTTDDDNDEEMTSKKRRVDTAMEQETSEVSSTHEPMDEN